LISDAFLRWRERDAYTKKLVYQINIPIYSFVGEFRGISLRHLCVGCTSLRESAVFADLKGPDMDFRIPDEHLDVFLAYIGLGVLKAIQRKTVPATVGIWTLALPKLTIPLTEKGSVSEEIMTVFKTADELSALEKLAPELFEDALEQLINQLETVLRSSSDPTWMTWEIRAD
jgi:hypothetical protein